MTQSVDLEMSQWLWFGGLVVISAGLPVMENKNKIIKPEALFINDRPELESRSTGSPKGESNSRTLTMLEAIKDVEGFYNKHFGKISISHDRILRKHGLNSASNIVPLRKK